MARKVRRQSSSGVHHVVMKGINGQEIFKGYRDFYKFIDVLKKCQELDHFDIFAYCMMSNHIHILIRVNETTIGKAIHRIGTTYAGWFNKKYKRTGQLFQNRFFSKPVETERYLTTVFRYILQNPMKAGLERYPVKGTVGQM